MDFTVKIYENFLKELTISDYNFQTFSDFLIKPLKKSIILRHDVDLKPHNSLLFAQIQAEYDVKGVYYFRSVSKSWDEKIIKKIHDLGHEVGYHYESLTIHKGNYIAAINHFKNDLEMLRSIVPVKTICMHGSPMSKYDSKSLWNKYNYRDYGIIGEPYFDIDFNKVLYLTDTGRTWNNNKISIRDKVSTNNSQDFVKTNDIINAIQTNKLNNQIMFTFHPQRWSDNSILWLKELLFQKFKNQIKKQIVKSKA